MTEKSMKDVDLKIVVPETGTSSSTEYFKSISKDLRFLLFHN